MSVWARGWLGFLLSAGLGHAQEVDFRRDIEPIFNNHCHICHGPQQQTSGLRLDRREDGLRGGYSGPAILPGNSAESLLFQRVTADKPPLRMPPVGEALSADQIAKLRTWIDQGANWEGEARPESHPTAATTTAATAPSTQSQHWAFQPIERPAPPSVSARAWTRNEIDLFVLARLESEAMAPSPEAARLTLLRRLSLDLIGVPPDPAESAEFLADNRPDAYERQVDRLLGSPHFGEKWGRWWLDLAHYADSDGYEKDQVRPFAWRYRQWVIEALNRDMAFDQFTVEQLAGDLLPGATVEQRVATGFLRQTLTNREAGVSREEIRFEQLVDRTNTASTTWLGLTAGCAQCHDHKYDPITQKDYYRLLTYFDRAEEENIEAPLPGEMGPYLRARPDFERSWRELLETHGIPPLQAEWEAEMLSALRNPGRKTDWDFAVSMMQALLDHGARMLEMEPARRTRREQELLSRYFTARPAPLIVANQELAAKFKELRARIAELDAKSADVTLAMTMRELTNPPKGYLRVRGDYRRKGIELDAGTPEFLPLPVGEANSRLALARWLVSRDNPLTARVTVNRVWQELFGIGIVRTSEDFGTQGERPSHPELLDWLASEFRDRDWSLKQIIRTMVTSATYRQSSRLRAEDGVRDPENRLLARQSRLRLKAELVRDSALATSGLLSTTIGGKSIRPPQPPGVAELGYEAVKWIESSGEDRYRRGLYVHFQRQSPYPQMMNFDAPDSLVVCSRRRTSNTPLQALNLLNDPVFFEAAQGLAVRILQEAPPSLDARVEFGFRAVLGRPPTPSEKKRLTQHYATQQAILEQRPEDAADLFPLSWEGAGALEAATWVGLGRVLLNLDEFVTRE